MNCEPSSLLQAAKCFRCLPKPELRASIIYALCQWANAQECDPDALAFLEAIGVSPDSTEGRALCQLVGDLKAYPEAAPEGQKYWDRDEIIYPLMGGTAASHAVNLKNPGTNDLTYPIAGLTHDASGMKGNGTAYANTGYLVPSLDSFRAMWYLDLDGTVDLTYYFGAFKVTATAGRFFGRKDGAGMDFSANDITTSDVAGASGLGAQFVQRYEAATKKAVYGSNTWTSANVNSTAIPNNTLFLLAVNQGTPAGVSNARLTGFSAGAPLDTDGGNTEHLEYKGIWDTFETALGRGHP